MALEYRLAGVAVACPGTVAGKYLHRTTTKQNKTLIQKEEGFVFTRLQYAVRSRFCLVAYQSTWMTNLRRYQQDL